MRLPQAQPLKIAEVGESSPAVVELTTSPATIAVARGTQASIDVIMDTHGAIVSGAIVELSYDPSLLSNVSVKQGDFLPVKLSGPKVAGGKISFIYAAPPDSGGKDGLGSHSYDHAHPDLSLW